jgi:hypothetical protein
VNQAILKRSIYLGVGPFTEFFPVLAAHRPTSLDPLPARQEWRVSSSSKDRSQRDLQTIRQPGEERY